MKSSRLRARRTFPTPFGTGLRAWEIETHDGVSTALAVRPRSVRFFGNGLFSDQVSFIKTGLAACISIQNMLLEMFNVPDFQFTGTANQLLLQNFNLPDY